jgi:hypothetical protein
VWWLSVNNGRFLLVIYPSSGYLIPGLATVQQLE